MLGIVDLAKIQDGALGDAFAVAAADGDAPVLDDAEVAVGFAVLPTLAGSQEHAGIVRPPVQPDKRAGLHYSRLANAVGRNAE
jgi:hypothetical protein